MRDDAHRASLALVAVRATDVVAYSSLRREPLLVHATRAAAAIAGAVAVLTDDDPARVRRALRAASIHDVLVLAADSSADLTTLDELQPARGVTLIHDPQCPLVSARDLSRLVGGARLSAQVGVRPVTDTIKSVVLVDGDLQVSATVDRDSYRVVCAPLAVPSLQVRELRSALGAFWPLRPLAELVGWIRERNGVQLVDIAAAGLRVEDEDGLWLLECIDDVRHRVRAR